MQGIKKRQFVPQWLLGTTQDPDANRAFDKTAGEPAVERLKLVSNTKAAPTDKKLRAA
jgi:hypothetical protein